MFKPIAFLKRLIAPLRGKPTVSVSSRKPTIPTVRGGLAFRRRGILRSGKFYHQWSAARRSAWRERSRRMA